MNIIIINFGEINMKTLLLTFILTGLVAINSFNAIKPTANTLKGRQLQLANLELAALAQTNADINRLNGN